MRRATATPSPSLSRRQALKNKEDESMYMTLSSMCNIERYYDTATKLLDKFHSSLASNQLDNAYIYGRRFANFSTQALPTHDYYHNSKNKLHVQYRKENVKAVQRVISELEQVVSLMDVEEVEKEELRQREEEAIRKIQERELLMRQEEQDRKSTMDLMKRFQMLDQIGTSTAATIDTTTTTSTNNNTTTSNTTTDAPNTTTLMSPNDDTTNNGNMMENGISGDTNLPIESLPPPIPYSQLINENDDGVKQSTNTYEPPSLPPPPSYDDVSSTTTTTKHDQSGRMSSQRSISTTSESKPPTKPKIPFHQIKTKSNKKYTQLTKSKQLQTFSLGTYQGRNKHPGKDSTNGCTVISALVTSHHLSSDGSGIADMTIDEIIDGTSPPLLKRIRQKLGLSEHALIIPSDVHDFMIDEGILKQEQFVEVCGGNLLEDVHVLEFLNLLKDAENEKAKSSKEQKKVAATLFFHEHVVSILKVVLSNGTSWFDLVDSMPTLQTNEANPTGDKILCGRRIRCKDVTSLECMLNWYACSKFTPSEIEFIDGHEWDDVMCDFDPRVFQAFIWKE